MTCGPISINGTHLRGGKGCYVGETKKAVSSAIKYQCNVCGYIYDPEKGDSDGGIKSGTPFEGIPASWACPVCGASKDMFAKIEE
jgi:rubredoxin